jgi:tetratricopeptide (TPR) repeat protein
MAVELLGSYLAAPERSLFPDLSQEALAKLAEPQQRLRLAQQRLGSKGGVVSLEETIALSLADLPAEVVRAFYALGAFAAKPERFSRTAAQAVSGVGGAELAVLVAYNLVEAEGESLALHQIMADVARTQVDETAVERHQDYYLKLANQDREDWRQIEGAYGQIKGAWQSVIEDRARLEWLWTLRTYQRRRGLWFDRLAWCYSGLEVAKRLRLRQDGGTILNEIGLVYANLGQGQKALEYYQQALPIQKEVSDRADWQAL